MDMGTVLIGWEMRAVLSLCEFKLSLSVQIKNVVVFLSQYMEESGVCKWMCLTVNRGIGIVEDMFI